MPEHPELLHVVRQNAKKKEDMDHIWVEFPHDPHALSSPKAGAIFHRLEDDDGSAEHHG